MNEKNFSYEISTYEKILNDDLKTFSPYFFNMKYRKKRLQILIRYLIEEKLKITKEEALTKLNLDILKKYKLLCILKYIEKPVELEKNDLSFLVYYAYPNSNLKPPTSKELTIEYYKKVLSKEKRSFPKNYFLDAIEGEKRAKYCVEYLVDEVLKIEKKDIPQKLTLEVIQKYNLKILFTTIYFSMYDLITNIYPNQFTIEDFNKKEGKKK